MQGSLRTAIARSVQLKLCEFRVIKSSRMRYTNTHTHTYIYIYIDTCTPPFNHPSIHAWTAVWMHVRIPVRGSNAELAKPPMLTGDSQRNMFYLTTRESALCLVYSCFSLSLSLSLSLALSLSRSRACPVHPCVSPFCWFLYTFASSTPGRVFCCHPLGARESRIAGKDGPLGMLTAVLRLHHPLWHIQIEVPEPSNTTRPSKDFDDCKPESLHPLCCF